MAEKHIEKLGWKAYRRGFFKEWQDYSLELIGRNPEHPKLEMYEKAYKKLKKANKVK